MTDIRFYPDLSSLVKASVELFVTLADESIKKQGYFTVALSGGSTPQPIYQALSEPDISDLVDWSHIHLFWGDERHVPHDHPDSNYRMVKEALLDRSAISDKNIHQVPVERDARLSAFSYEEELRCFFDGSWPQFDLVFLGMGTDGHTASLFPHTAGLSESHRWFIANYSPKLESWRLTLTKKAINAARNIAVIVSGESKAATLAEVFTGTRNPVEKPIQYISPTDGRMIWLIDQTAASRLPRNFVSGKES
jgi:6-phosphogluconolactonase